MTHTQTHAEDYTLVQFPLVQIYWESDWFQEEAILHQATNVHQNTLKSAYFIPNCRLRSKTKIANGLAEAQSLLRDLISEDDQGDYHKVIFKSLQDAINCMQNYN